MWAARVVSFQHETPSPVFCVFKGPSLWFFPLASRSIFRKAQSTVIARSWQSMNGECGWHFPRRNKAMASRVRMPPTTGDSQNLVKNEYMSMNRIRRPLGRTRGHSKTVYAKAQSTRLFLKCIKRMSDGNRVTKKEDKSDLRVTCDENVTSAFVLSDQFLDHRHELLWKR